jgi:quinol monooxygenase YgiN
MRRFYRAAIAIAVPFLAGVPSVLAQDASNSAVYVVSYVEAAPLAKTKVMGLLKQLSDASRKEAGVLRFEVLQRLAPAQHFALLEVWKDQQALDAHTGAVTTKTLASALEPLLMSPIDERIYNPIAVGPVVAAPPRARTIITHVDMGPPNPANRDWAIPAMTAFAEATRKEAGNLRYDVLQQKGRTNHFEVIEVWKDQKSADAHEAAPRTLSLRAEYAPRLGGLYDQRWFNPM